MGKTEIVAEPGTQSIDITREFDAPRDLVFRAFSDPDLIGKWLGGTRMTMEIDTFEPRDGGRWRYIHRTPDGQEFAFRGVFHGPQTVDGMLQTFEFEGWPGKVALESMTFEERDDKTVIHQHSVYQSVADRDGMIESGMESGLNDGFAALDELLASITATRR